MEEKGKKLGLWNLIGFGVGNVIGTGIFVMMGYGIANTGRSIVLSLAGSVLFMLLANWFCISMSTMFIFKDGDYGMKRLLSNPTVTGINAWFTVINSFGFASLTLAFTDYLCILFPVLEDHTKLTAFCVSTICFAITVRGSRFLTLVENLITVILIIALVTFVAFGVGSVDLSTYFSATYDGGFFHGGFSGFIAAISVMSFACMGQTSVCGMAAVSKKPKKNIPLSMLLVAVVIIFVYCSMGFVAGGVLPYDQIAGENISVTAEAVLPGGLYLFFVAGGGLCAIASSLLSTLGYIRYPMIRIANEGWLPSIFKKQTKSGYPYVTYGMYYLIGLLPLIFDMDLDAVVSLAMVPMMLIQLYMNAACIVLPKKYPEQWEKRSIRIPKVLYYFCCVVGTLCAGAVAYELFIALSVTEMIIAVVFVAALVILSVIRLKQGAVDIKELEEQRQQIITEAIAADIE